MSKRLLQVVNLVLAMWIIFRAGLTVLEGTDNPLYGTAGVPALPALDSNLRFLGGTGLALAAILIWITPAIERHTVLFRTVWGCRFIGGIGRLVSIAIVGSPPIPMLALTVSEVFIIPPLLFWQRAIAKSTVGHEQPGDPVA